MQDNAVVQLEPDETSATVQHSILIVDDDSGQTEALSYRLRSQGFQTLTALCGKEGLAVARAQHPHLVLLDLGLPDIDGLQVCERLADDPTTCTIPVIVLSGMARPDIIRCARAVGCRYYVRKPYDPSALLILIESAIHETESW